MPAPVGKNDFFPGENVFGQTDQSGTPRLLADARLPASLDRKNCREVAGRITTKISPDRCETAKLRGRSFNRVGVTPNI